MDNLLQWNAFQIENQDVDYLFGLSLLLSLISLEQIQAGQIDNNAWNFMLGMLLSRISIFNTFRVILSIVNKVSNGFFF